MGTAMQAALFVFEVPTSVVADTYGRKLLPPSGQK